MVHSSRNIPFSVLTVVFQPTVVVQPPRIKLLLVTWRIWFLWSISHFFITVIAFSFLFFHFTVHCFFVCQEKTRGRPCWRKSSFTRCHHEYPWATHEHFRCYSTNSRLYSVQATRSYDADYSTRLWLIKYVSFLFYFWQCSVLKTAIELKRDGF